MAEYHKRRIDRASNKIRPGWFSTFDVNAGGEYTGDVISYGTLLDVFDTEEVDAKAFDLYKKSKKVEGDDRPGISELKHTRMQLLFMTAVTQTIHRQFTATEDNAQLSSVDDQRYLAEAQVPSKVMIQDLKERVTISEDD